MYNKTLIVCIAFFSFQINFSALVLFEPSANQKKLQRFMEGSVEFSLKKELYPFFAARMAEFPIVEQTSYDVDKQVARCRFNRVLDTEAIQDKQAFYQFLHTDKKPRRGHMRRPLFVLNAFAKLNEILTSTRIFIFNEQKNGILLNPAFGHFNTSCPDLFEYFASIEYSLHVCAYLARIPVLQYRI